MRSGRHHGAWGGLEEVSDQIRCQVSRGRSDKKDGVGVGQAVRRAGWAGGAMASLRVSSSNNLQVKSAARHTSIPGARASGGARKVWRHTDRPRLEHRPDEIGKKDGMDAPPKTCPCGVCALAIISPGPRDNSSRSSPTRRPRMKPKAQQTLAPATPPPPLPSLPTTPCRTKKEKTIKTHQSPPSSAEHAVVPPRPSAAAAHGVAHVDGNAAASFFASSPKNQSCCSIRRFVRVAPRPKSCCCCCAPASINAIVVQSVGGRRSCWLWSVGRRVDSRRGSLGLAGCFGGGVVRQKSWAALRRALRFCLLRSHFGGGPATGGWRLAGLTLDMMGASDVCFY